MKALLSLLMVLAAALIATPVCANTVYAPGQGSQNKLEVGIDVKASVRDRCGFASNGAPSGTLSQAQFDETGFSKDFAIILNCSGASRVAVTSSKGGLTTATTGATGYATTAPYDVTLSLVADNATTASATCAASGLTAGGSCTALVGTASSATGLRLSAPSTKSNGSFLRVSAPRYSTSAAPLVSGSYSDTLTITVSAAS